MTNKRVKLGDIAIVIAGQSPDGKNYNKEGVGTPFYQGKKAFGEKFLKAPNVWTKSITKVAIKDDILISVRAPVGALNISTQRICIGRGLAAIRVNSDIDKDFLFYSLTQTSNKLVGTTGAIFNSLNKTQIENIELFLPPLSEQKRIVTKLDKTFEEIDLAIKITEKKKGELELLKSSILNKELEQGNEV